MVCTKCVMDTSDPDIQFDVMGVCNHCREYEKNQNFETLDDLSLVKGEKEYDCIIGLSGGVDSSYVAYYVVKILKMKPLAIHVDNGWNSVQAVKNVKSICDSLAVDLETIVLNWGEFKEIQKAFILAKSADVEIPTDHAIFYGVFNFCQKFDVPLINGINRKYESHHPLAWSQGHLDGLYIKSVYRSFFKKKLKKFKTGGFIFFWKWNSTTSINLLDYIDYDREKALETIKTLGWEEYGGKHEESTFTKWFQQVYLPDVLGIDKRKMHLSSLICAGELKRKQGLDILERPATLGLKKELLTDYVLDKLEISSVDYNALKHQKRSAYKDYRSFYGLLIQINKKLKR